MLYLGVEHFLPSQAVRRHRSLLLPLPQCLVYYEHKVTALLYENTYSFLSKEHKAGIISLHSGMQSENEKCYHKAQCHYNCNYSGATNKKS